MGINNGDSLIVDQIPLVNNKPGKTVFRVKEIADDNSCLFNAVACCLEDKESPQALRNIIISVILSNPTIYNEVFLGCSPDSYCEIIGNGKSWGGGIELSIFSDYFQIEIVAIDIETLTPLIFGEDKNFKKRMFLLYRGIHYDTIEAVSGSSVVRTFDSNDSDSFASSLSVAEIEQSVRESLIHISKKSLLMFQSLH
jgi:ubiquitin thioesterase OTU1